MRENVFIELQKEAVKVRKLFSPHLISMLLIIVGTCTCDRIIAQQEYHVRDETAQNSYHQNYDDLHWLLTLAEGNSAPLASQYLSSATGIRRIWRETC